MGWPDTLSELCRLLLLFTFRTDTHYAMEVTSIHV